MAIDTDRTDNLNNEFTRAFLDALGVKGIENSSKASIANAFLQNDLVPDEWKSHFQSFVDGGDPGRQLFPADDSVFWQNLATKAKESGIVVQGQTIDLNSVLTGMGYTGGDPNEFLRLQEMSKQLEMASRAPNISQDQYNRLLTYTQQNNALPADLGSFFGPTPMVRSGFRAAGQAPVTRTYSTGKDTASGIPFIIEPSGNAFYARPDLGFQPVSSSGNNIYQGVQDLIKQAFSIS